MKLGGHISAAIEILEMIYNHHLPASRALSDWGRSHRFAGSKDRSVIGHLVFDVLRQKISAGAYLGQYDLDKPSPRAQVLGILRFVWGLDLDEIKQAFDNPHAPPALTDKELKYLKGEGQQIPTPAAPNIPPWVLGDLEDLFGDDFVKEAGALCTRAPIDIRVNRLTATKEKLKKSLQKFAPQEVDGFADLLRFVPPEKGAKAPALESTLAHGKGWFEIQDAGSQLVSQLTGAKAGMQVLDYCAGGGGKTLALASLMGNKGQIYAYDNNAHRFRSIIERLKRAKARNVQLLEAGQTQALKPLESKMDIVLVDAPCTGTGTWRRNPDSKWRLKPAQLEKRLVEQTEILQKAKTYVKPGGKLIYVTCSLLRAENDQQIEGFLKEAQDFELVDFQSQWQEVMGTEPIKTICPTGKYLLLTPHSHSTDGFFMVVLRKN